MSHLSIETLARLVDETPDVPEAAHLQACAECSAELEGLKADAAALARLPELEPPAAQWYGLERKLADEGLLRLPTRRAAGRWLRPALQIAAALALFVLGVYLAPLIRDPGRTGYADSSGTAPVAPAGDATAAVRAAEQAYLNALTRYAELNAGAEQGNPVARLAALESIVLTTGAALGQAPADPVINGYHMTALAQRDAIRKQLASASGKTWF